MVEKQYIDFFINFVSSFSTNVNEWQMGSQNPRRNLRWRVLEQ